MIFVLTIINNVNVIVRTKIICHYLFVITQKTNTRLILVFSWEGVRLNSFGMSEEEEGVLSISSMREGSFLNDPFQEYQLNQNICGL